MEAAEVAAVEARIKVLQARLAANIERYDTALDTVWALVTAAMVIFMHCGFTALETGSVRVKNVSHVLAKNVSVTTVSFLCWYLVGFSLAYGERDDANTFIGSSSFMALRHLNGSRGLFRRWFFQGAFCATSATIVSGAMAERTKLVGFMVYVIALTSLIYPVVVFWVWSGHGYLCDGGESIVGPAVKDFAGSGVVHIVGGVGALCGAIIVGPRTGRWDEDKADEFKGHNIPLCVLGTVFLWFGWYGFNPGSTGQMHDRLAAHRAALVAVNTTLCPCSSGLLCFFLQKMVMPPRNQDVPVFCNGILAGLVSITASCGFVKPWEALIIGTFGGLLYTVTSMRMRIHQVDDVVDAFSVHGVCGFWGLVAAGIFGNPGDGMGGNGLLYMGNQIGIQILSALIITAWSACMSCAILVPLKRCHLLRHSDQVQRLGADLASYVSSQCAQSEMEMGSETRSEITLFGTQPFGSQASSRAGTKDRACDEFAYCNPPPRLPLDETRGRRGSFDGGRNKGNSSPKGSSSPRSAMASRRSLDRSQAKVGASGRAGSKDRSRHDRSDRSGSKDSSRSKTSQHSSVWLQGFGMSLEEGDSATPRSTVSEKVGSRTRRASGANSEDSRDSDGNGIRALTHLRATEHAGKRDVPKVGSLTRRVSGASSEDSRDSDGNASRALTHLHAAEHTGKRDVPKVAKSRTWEGAEDDAPPSNKSREAPGPRWVAHISISAMSLPEPGQSVRVCM